MPESFVEKRKRELGLTSSSSPTPSTSSSGSSFVERRKRELGLIPQETTHAFDRPVRPTQIETTPSRRPINGLVEMDEASPTTDIETKARQVPYLGGFLRGIDKTGEFLESNPVTHFINQTGRDIMATGGA